MTFLARVLVGLLALVFLGFGLLYLIYPQAPFAQTALSLIGAGGMENARAYMGAPLLTFGMLLLSGAVKLHSEHILMVMIFLVFVAIGHGLGFLLEGGFTPHAMRIMTVIGSILFVCLIAYFIIMRSENRLRQEAYELSSYQ